MPEAVHLEPPHELTEGSHGPSDGSSHRLELVATLLLAISTVGIAWSGYQAARWSGFESELYASATHSRALANRAEERAGQGELQDLLNFNRWLEVTAEGRDDLADLVNRGFRAQFRPAFDAWLAQDPLVDQDAISSPLQMPQYQLPGYVRAERLDTIADVQFERAKAATDNTDDYVLLTVFLAVVLFFAGISLRFTWQKLRVVVLTMAALFLVYAVVRLIDLPVH